MASLVSGYSFDIFISYRQKDNKYDGWVTEFVGNLRKELEATFKDEVNIFFDASPTDGLQETHDVDDSLKEKLKCLVFIPIISHTYCDPNSFAWKNELLEFKSLATNDALGLKVKVSGGNVASRILPVVIHELDQEDRGLLEGELGPIRAIDFVLQSLGVNRPLRAKDDDLRPDGSRQPLYRDQVNKVANAVKGIISGIRQPSSEITTVQEAPTNRSMTPRIKIVGILAAVFMFLIIGYFYLEARNRRPVSIAVLPFVDMSPNHDQEWFTDGMSEELINVLTRVPALEVKARTSSFAFRGTTEDIRVIGQKLGATHVLEGSVRQVGDLIRVTAQLIQVSDGNHIWSETYNRKGRDFILIQDEIANAVVRKLSTTIFGREPVIHSRDIDPRAINSYLQGRYNTMHHHTAEAIKNYWTAIRIDSAYVKAWAGLAWTYSTMFPSDSLSGIQILRKREQYAGMAYRLDPEDPDAMRAMIQLHFGRWNWKEMEGLCWRALKQHPKNAEVITFGSWPLLLKHHFDSAIAYSQRAITNDPLNYLWHADLANNYLLKGDLVRAEESMRTGLSLGRDVPGMFLGMSNLFFAKGDYGTALKYLDSIDAKQNDWILPELFYPIYAMGRKQEANRLLDSIRTTIGQHFAAEVGACYAYKGSYDSAFMFFEAARKDSASSIVYYLAMDYRMPSALKLDPRYKELVRSVGLNQILSE